MKRLNLLLIMIITVSFASSGSEWNLRQDKDFIKIYTREAAGSSFKEFKAETVIKNTDIYTVLDVIFDVKNYDRLFPDCKDPKILKPISKYHNIQYLIIKTPWPLDDRDNITDLEAHFSKDSSSVTVTIKLLPQYLKEKKGLLRLKKGNGFWKLKRLKDNRVKVIYQYHSSPGGAVPAWLANSFVIKHPYKTLLNLRNRVKSEQ